jgi:PAS domain S-box-containing protein
MRQNQKQKTGVLATVKSVIDHSLTAWLILAVSLVFTLVAWLLSNQYIENRAEDRFAFRMMQVREQISDRMLKYEQLLRSSVGLFVSSDHVSRNEWKTYIANCELKENFGGVQGIGYARVIHPTDLNLHVDEIRSEGFAEYSIKPEGIRERYTSIVFLEPFDWRNRRAFGFDMYTESVRRKAMDRAIDTGKPSLSGMVTLQQETSSDIQNGFLCYLPIFKKGTDTASVESRRRNIEGFVFAPFRAEDLMAGIFDEISNDVKFELYDAGVVEPSCLLFDSDRKAHFESGESSRLTAEVPLEIRGRKWTLFFETEPNFFHAGERVNSLIVAFGGLTVDILLFLIIAMVGRQRKQAIKLANDKEHDLKKSEQLNRSILDNASEAMVVANENGVITIFNNAAELTFGRARCHVIGKTIDTLLQMPNWKSLQMLFEAGASWTPSDRLLRGIGGNGEAFPCSVSISQVVAGDGNLYILIARDETERIESEKKLADVNRQLMDASRKSGMAEVATGVLHNVGNVLNSLNVSLHVIDGKLDGRVHSRINKAVDLLSANSENLEDFFSNDSRGKHLPAYLQKLSSMLLDDQTIICDEVEQLQKHIEHINEIVRAQQGNATSQSFYRQESPSELMEDAATFNEHRNHEFDICISKEFFHGSSIETDRHKVLQILVNLIKNAQDSLAKTEGRKRKICLRSETVDREFVDLIVEDNGIGISKEQIENVLRFGYSTKLDGHGFGLHSSLNTANQIGAELRVESDGEDKGARFVLRIPVKQPLELQRRDPWIASCRIPSVNNNQSSQTITQSLSNQ